MPPIFAVRDPYGTDPERDRSRAAAAALVPLGSSLATTIPGQIALADFLAGGLERLAAKSNPASRNGWRDSLSTPCIVKLECSMKPSAWCSATFAALAIASSMPSQAIGTHFWIRLKTDVQGLDVSVQTGTAAGVVAFAQLENRTDRTVYCSVGFFHGFDLRKRTAHALAPREKRPYVFRVHQHVASVPVEVNCAERRDALPPNYL